MSTINKVLIGCVSMVCTAVTLTAAVSPAIGIAWHEQARGRYSSSARVAPLQEVVAMPKRPVTAGADTCASRGKQPDAQCLRNYAVRAQGQTFSLFD